MSPALAALLQVILIDIVLAGDNALVIGMVAARVPKASRKRVIFWALVVAVVLRIVLALITATLLQIIGLMFAGGLLLLWVTWRLYREIQHAAEERIDLQAMREAGGPETVSEGIPMRKAIVQVALADISMSLDNVLAVAGAAMEHVWVLTIGLLLSIALMGVAASMIANLLQRHPWISYAGLLIVLYVAVRMVWVGGWEIVHARERDARISVPVTVLSDAAISGRCRPPAPSAVRSGRLCPA